MVKFSKMELMGLGGKGGSKKWEGKELGMNMNKDKVEWFTWETLLGATGIN